MNKEINFDSLVICSTLNQMVNYVVIKEHDIKNVYNIRMENNYRSFNYDEWDKNIKGCGALDDVIFQENIEFYQNDIRNHNQIKDKLVKKFGKQASDGQKFKLKDEKILWNITGGQRHFVMAITDYVYNNRPDDVIVYFEGDNEKMYYYKKDSSIREDYIYREDHYPMSIPLALRLMGFKLSEESKENIKNTSQYYKLLTSNNLEEFKTKCKNENMSYIKNKSIEDTYKTIKQEYDWYNEFYKLYVCNKTLRKLLINSNRFKNSKDESDKKIEVSILKRIKEEIKSCDEVYLNGKNNVFDEKGFSILEKSIGKHDTGKVFGYILEKMSFYRIIKELKKDHNLMNKIADIDLSVKIKDLDHIEDEIVDEFDILMVTKKGKVIMFECKSGGMTGDNAKSHNYSTYAIAGVYGTPILICPLIKYDFIKDKEKYLTKTNNALDKSSPKLNSDTYKYVKQAIKSAEKVNLKICYVDELANNIKNLLGE